MLLVQACEKFDSAKIKQLLDIGADANSVDYNGSNTLLIVLKQCERAILESKPDVNVFIDVVERLRKAGADPFLENENGECAADHTDERVNLAVEHALRYVKACNSDTPNQLEAELSCYASHVDFFDKGKVNQEFVRKDAEGTAAKFPVRKYYNVRDVDSEAVGCARPNGRYSYHVALTCDCDYVGTKGGGRTHMVMRNHYVISFVKGKPQITSIRTVINPDKNGDNELGVLLYEFDADYALSAECRMEESPSLGLLGFNERERSCVTKKNSLGRTMRHYACAQGRAMLVKWLLEQGADPDVADNAGRLPEHYLPIINRRIIMNLLKHHRAKRHN